MKNDMNKLLKDYFENEVSRTITPPLPKTDNIKGKKIKWDFLFLAACILGSFILILNPSTYNNKIRKSYIPMSKFEAFKEEFPRVIFEASLYFKNR